ncbi:hypothetical protein BHE74_00035143 [Ensete ventricosum]|nr:hypothetical protein BHE74_00035143 [Ensete ventricosum]
MPPPRRGFRRYRRRRRPSGGEATGSRRRGTPCRRLPCLRRRAVVEGEPKGVIEDEGKGRRLQERRTSPKARTPLPKFVPRREVILGADDVVSRQNHRRPDVVQLRSRRLRRASVVGRRVRPRDRCRTRRHRRPGRRFL